MSRAPNYAEYNEFFAKQLKYIAQSDFIKKNPTKKSFQSSSGSLLLLDTGALFNLNTLTKEIADKEKHMFENNSKFLNNFFQERLNDLVDIVFKPRVSEKEKCEQIKDILLAIPDGDIKYFTQTPFQNPFSDKTEETNFFDLFLQHSDLNVNVAKTLIDFGFDEKIFFRKIANYHENNDRVKDFCYNLKNKIIEERYPDSADFDVSPASSPSSIRSESGGSLSFDSFGVEV